MKFINYVLLSEAVDISSFGDRILSNVDDVLPWLVAADYAADHDDYETEKYLRSAVILVERGEDGIKEACNLVHVRNVPSERKKLFANYVKYIPWFKDWVNKVDMRALFLSGILESELYDVLPHGSGVNLTWHIRSDFNQFICDNGYQVMDEGGGYVGWLHFALIIPFTDPDNIELIFNERDVRRMEGLDIYVDGIEEELSEMFVRAIRDYIS